ncbi:MAG TPA: hypothetical protein DER58_06250, partial [Firmicutes bacterium]|nr:hypothetical protein [Bacillota bacterium]
MGKANRKRVSLIIAVAIVAVAYLSTSVFVFADNDTTSAKSRLIEKILTTNVALTAEELAAMDFAELVEIAESSGVDVASVLGEKFKSELIKEILDDDGSLTFEELSSMSVSELLAYVEAHNVDVDTDDIFENIDEKPEDDDD